METGKGVSPATSQKKKHPEGDILFGFILLFAQSFKVFQ